MAQAGEQYQTRRDIWNDYNAAQKFEHELINRKTTWWLTTQTILFAAYGVTLKPSDVPEPDVFRKVFGSVGFLVALVTFAGVVALIISKFISWRDYCKFYERSPLYSPPQPLEVRKLQWGVRTLNTFFTLLPDLFLPLIFALAWFRLVPDVPSCYCGEQTFAARSEPYKKGSPNRATRETNRTGDR
jgi:hypothetical protein